MLMNDITQIVDSLENRISKLLHKLEVLHKANAKITQDLVIVEHKNSQLQLTIEEWEEKYKSSQLANTMLGSETNKREAKLKINTLIREIDHCIAQLSE
jgi:chromosome segregation ATPase